MPTVVSLNGSLVAPEEASVSVFDEGFLSGDLVYEVLRSYAGLPFELGLHLDRLERSAARIGLPFDGLRAAFERDIATVMQAASFEPVRLRLVHTRGGGSSYDPRDPRQVLPCRLVIGQRLRPPAPALYETGAAAIYSRPHATADDPHAKTGRRSRNLLAQAEARAAGAEEALMLGEGEEVLEGASSTLFIVAGGTLLTPPLAAGILEGVTRAVVLRLAEAEGLTTLQLRLDPRALAQAQELFITSTSRGLLPITQLDGAPVGDGRPGPVYRRLAAAFSAYTQAYAKAQG